MKKMISIKNPQWCKLFQMNNCHGPRLPCDLRPVSSTEKELSLFVKSFFNVYTESCYWNGNVIQARFYALAAVKAMLLKFRKYDDAWFRVMMQTNHIWDQLSNGQPAGICILMLRVEMICTTIEFVDVHTFSYVFAITRSKLICFSSRSNRTFIVFVMIQSRSN